jgi:hypothetical protein
MKKLRVLLFLLVCASAVLMTSLASSPTIAQTKPEVCDNGVDDDGDKLVDCEDPDCKCDPKGTPCSPGYWKNHKAAFDQYCGQVPGWTCDQLWTALTCRGSDASCRRQAAAAALNAVSGCTE